MALDERGPGIGGVLVPLLETATATVEYVITLAARGWPAGGGRGIVYSFLEEALAARNGGPQGKARGGGLPHWLPGRRLWTRGTTRASFRIRRALLRCLLHPLHFY